MKRLAILSFYDPDGIVDDYVLYLLKELKNVSTDLYFTVNGKLEEEGRRKVEKITSHIIIRNNLGFDAGGYADTLINYIGSKRVRNYDEVILCNNTFFGPFISMKKIFEHMNQYDVNFWGLDFFKDYIVPHIQSYFLVFRREIVSTGILNEFFEENIDINEKDVINILVNFETGIYQYLTGKGFKSTTYGIPNNCDIYKSGNYAIKKYNLPILKRKIDFSVNSYHDNFFDAVRFIKDNTEYDISLITKYIKRKYGIDVEMEGKLNCKEYCDLIRIKSIEEIQRLVKNYNKAFIYGTGSVGKKIYKTFNSNGIRIDGFTESDGQSNHFNSLYDLPVYYFSELSYKKDICFIVAMNQKSMSECKEQLEKYNNVIWIIK